MAWWILVLVEIAGVVLQRLLTPKLEGEKPVPGSLNDFKAPTIGEGRPIPIAWGHCRIDAPMVAWYGDLEVAPFGSGGDVLGYVYYLGMQLVLCSGPIDGVYEVLLDGRSPNATYTTGDDSTEIEVDDQFLFGGRGSEGGFLGPITVYHGTRAQNPDPYLEEVLETVLPAWRGIVFAVVKHCYVGTVPRLLPVAFTVRRHPNGLGLTGGNENIGGDANPACMIFDLLTSPASGNGLGFPEGLIDLPAFREAGDTFTLEGLGLSMLQDRATSAGDLIREILRHVDAVVYCEPTTGLLTIRLIRADYDVDDLPVLDSDNCTLRTFARPSWSELKNVVRVSYIDRLDGHVEKIAQEQDLAAIQLQGGEVSIQEINFRGLSNAGNAQKAAARALRALSYPLASLMIDSDRSAWAFRPGSVFKLVWPPLGIAGMACRVIRIGTGNLDSGLMQIEAIEDVFGVDWTAYTEPPASGWIDPAGAVPALTAQAAMAAPYEAAKEAMPPEAQRAVVMATRGAGGLTSGFRTYCNDGEGGWFSPAASSVFTLSGSLLLSISESSAGLAVSGAGLSALRTASGPEFAQGFNLAWLWHEGFEEFIAFRDVTVDGNEATLEVLARGCLDTAPTAFPEGTRVWFYSYGKAFADIRGPIPPSPELVNMLRFQPFNNLGEQVFAECDDTGVQARAPSRRELVYCPTAVKFNGESYPSVISGELTVSWSHRDRLGLWSYADSGACAAPEPGTEYDVLVYGELGTLVHSEIGLTGTSWTYLAALEISESGLGRLNDHLRVIIKTWSAARAAEAFQVIDFDFARI